MQTSKKSIFAFFFLFLLVFVAISQAHITISPNVMISFGCKDEVLPTNCSNGGNYYFNTTLLNNETPAYSFDTIELYSNYSVWDGKKICRNTPFYQIVELYSHIFDWVCCDSEWLVNYTECSINDTRVKYYYDKNSCLFPNNVPLDNGTIEYCNYCSADIQVILGECLDNSTQLVSYYDYNYYTCCAVTGLESDCLINYYPYNETYYQGCNSTNANIGKPECRTIAELSDTGRYSKEDCVIHIPEQYANKDYKCFSIVKEKDTNKIVQVNPDRNRTLPIRESRDYFTPLNNIVNFYYTSQNLQPEKEYIVKLECSSNDGYIYSEYEIERKYENLSWIYYRIIWLKENLHYVIGFVILLILLLVILKTLFF